MNYRVKKYRFIIQFSNIIIVELYKSKNNFFYAEMWCNEDADNNNDNIQDLNNWIGDQKYKWKIRF